MPNEHQTVIKNFRIPIPPELDKTCGIGAERDGDSYVMKFTGTDQDLCVMAVVMLRHVGARNITVEEKTTGEVLTVTHA
jgi:hypothetical protein